MIIRILLKNSEVHSTLLDVKMIFVPLKLLAIEVGRSNYQGTFDFCTNPSSL